MMQFAEVFSDLQIVVTLSRQLTWSHFLVLIPLKSVEAKQFYAQLIINEKLGVRELRKQIANKAFERTEIANLQTGKNENIPINTFKDPYLLDFLGLQNNFLEKDIETAILHELENFILESTVNEYKILVYENKNLLKNPDDYEFVNNNVSIVLNEVFENLNDFINTDVYNIYEFDKKGNLLIIYKKQDIRIVEYYRQKDILSNLNIDPSDYILDNWINNNVFKLKKIK